MPSTSPEQRKGYSAFKIVKPPVVATATALVATSVALTAWACFAEIPVIVNAIGVLEPVGALFSVESPSAGSLIYPFQKTKESVTFKPPKWSDKAYQYLEAGIEMNDKALYKLIAETIQYLNSLESQRVSFDTFSLSLENDNEYAVGFNQKDIIAFVENPASKVRLIRSLYSLTQSLKLYKTLKVEKSTTLKFAQSAAQEQQEMLKPLEKLMQEGALSKTDFLREKAQASNLSGQASSSQASIDDIRRQIQNNRTELRNAYADFLRDSAIFAQDSGYISSFIIPQWTSIQPGQQIMILSWNRKVQPFTVPMFVNQGSSGQITVGNPIITTPLGFNPAEIGGIKGKVASISSSPLSTGQLVRKIGSEGLAASVIREGTAYQINVKLEREDDSAVFNKNVQNNRGGYLWNNNSNPPVPPRQGMILMTQVVTRHRTPLEMLIPAVREFLGVETPNRFNLLETSKS